MMNDAEKPIVLCRLPDGREVAFVPLGIPCRYLGAEAERLLGGDDRRYPSAEPLEVELAKLWGAKAEQGLLEEIMRVSDGPNISATPRTTREWDVAHYAAATVIQYLGTIVGRQALFLRALERIGVEYSVKFPEDPSEEHLDL